MGSGTIEKSPARSRLLGAAFLAGTGLIASGQTPGPLGYSIVIPRPISPAEGTTNPSARATQVQNPYLGSVPSKNTGARMELSLKGALDRGLRYNLGLIESSQASADVRAERLRALSALLPQLSAVGRQGYENLSYKEIGLKLRPIPGLPRCHLPVAHSDIRMSASASHSPFKMRGSEIGTALGRAMNRRRSSASRIRAT